MCPRDTAGCWRCCDSSDRITSRQPLRLPCPSVMSLRAVCRACRTVSGPPLNRARCDVSNPKRPARRAQCPGRTSSLWGDGQLRAG
jgi:hypothetical protein